MLLLIEKTEQLFSYSHVIEILSLLISFFTLIIALIISKKFGRNHMKIKQIDHVCNLIEYLNSTKISISFSTYKGGGAYTGVGSGIKCNLFEIGKYEEIDKDRFNKEFEDERIFFYKKCNQLFDIKEYIDSPLTPRIIADELFNFYNTKCYILKDNELTEEINFVEIKTDIWNEYILSNKNETGALIYGDANALTTWLNLKEHSKELKKNIGLWLIKNGINENNIRQDFKN